MTDSRTLRLLNLTMALLATAVISSRTMAGDLIPINLELRPTSQTVFIGTTVEIGLYAVTEQDQQLFRALDMVFVWDPTYLELLGVDDTGAVDLLYSGFPSGDPYNLNEVAPPADGDGYYRAWAEFGAPIEITTAGALLTTFEFTAIALTTGTLVDIPVSGGSPVLETIVWGGPGANTDVTGTLGSALVEIVIPEPGSLSLLVVGVLVALRQRRRSSGGLG